MTIEEDFFVVWKITCMKGNLPIRIQNKDISFIIVDEGDDPTFHCSICGAESNHLPPNKGYVHLNRWLHYKELIGRVKYKDLEVLALKDKRGWEIDEGTT